MIWDRLVNWGKNESFKVSIKSGTVEVKVDNNEKKVKMIFPSFTTAAAFSMIIGSDSVYRRFIDIKYLNNPISYEEDIPKINDLAIKITQIIDQMGCPAMEWDALPARSEDQINQKRTKEKEEVITPFTPSDSYSKTYHLNKINNTDAQLALDRLLEEMGKKSSVLIKYFPNTIAIFIGSYKFMHITTMPSYFSLHIYRKFEGDTLSSFQNISKNVKIDNDGVDIKIEKVSEVEDLIKLNL